MLVLSRVCAEFRDRAGNVIHRVTPATSLTFHEAPEAVREDPLFRLLLEEGSLEAAESPSRRKKLEADPLEGADASGRKRKAGTAQAEAPESGAEAAKNLTNRAKNDMIKETKEEIDHLESISTALDMAMDEASLSDIRKELSDCGYIKKHERKNKEKSSKSKPHHYISSEGYDI